MKGKDAESEEAQEHENSSGRHWRQRQYLRHAGPHARHAQDASGELHFTDWNCRAGQNNVIIRTDGTVAPCFPMYPSTLDWGNIDKPKFDQQQLKEMKHICERHCFSTLNHNLGYCYKDARVIKWVWKQAVSNRMKGGASSFED